MLGVLESEDNFAGEPCVHLMNPVDVYKGSAMNAEELCGIEATLEFSNGLVDTMLASDHNCVGKLVLSDEMSDVVKREK